MKIRNALLCGILAVALSVLPVGSSSAQGNGNGNGQGNGNANGHAEGNNGNGNPADAGVGVDASDPATQQSTETDALKAVQAGAAVPLGRIMDAVKSAQGGRVIDTQLVTVEGVLLYAIKVLAPDGKVGIAYFYAKSGRPVAVP